MSSNNDTKLDDKHTDVDEEDVSKSTASSGAADDNFAVFESPAKLAAKAKCGSAVADKEVAAACKRKPNAATVPHQKKRPSPIRKLSSPTLTKTTMIRTLLNRAPLNI